MTPLEFSQLAQTIPLQPGVYRYYDKEDRILYVGKAKSLRKRVSQYFQIDRLDNYRLKLMVSRIARIEFTIVDTELDALLLENALIKKHQPRFNIRLKDDKSYPYIVIKNEPYPRVQVIRQFVKDGSRYFGPYASGNMMYTILELVNRIYPLRNCTLPLSEKNITAGKFRVCLEYQIGNCLGPCEAHQSKADYDANIEAIADILKGSYHKAAQLLRDEMKAYAAELAFEKAAKVKFKLDALINYQSKSAVVNTNITNIDVFSIAQQDDMAVINYFHMQHGTIVISHNLEIQKTLDETNAQLLSYALIELRNKFNSQAREILLSESPDAQPEGLDLQVPRIGDKRKLVELSLKNAFYHLNDLLLQRQKRSAESRSDGILQMMQEDLRLKTLPRHIECFDNSNFHGDYAVSACVVFRNAKPSKKDYRHFNVNTVVGANDFATMEEVITRRYKRLLEEKQPLPDLLIVDGGKGQLSSAVNALKALGIYHQLPVLGIAKNLEELFYPNDPVPLHIDKTRYTLKVIQQMRDEAHRFGITHHRDKRSKGTIKSALSDIPGIGPKTTELLLRTFKSVKGLEEAGPERLIVAIGPAKADIVLKWLKERQPGTAPEVS